MKCHAGVEFESGKPCPKCHAKLGEVCWPGINADLLEVVQLRKENERLRSIVRVNGLRWGHTHAEIDALLAIPPSHSETP
jgi:hypothetical protein